MELSPLIVAQLETRVSEFKKGPYYPDLDVEADNILLKLVDVCLLSIQEYFEAHRCIKDMLIGEIGLFRRGK